MYFKKYRRALRAATIILVVSLMFFTALALPGFASSAASAYGVDEAMEELDTFKDQVTEVVYKLATIAEFLAGASFAFGVIKWLLGTEKERERAMNHMKFSLAALFAIYLLPWVAITAVNVFKQYQWTPSSL